MDQLTVLERAADGFAATLAQVQDDQWEAPTPNDGQSVRELVAHVIGGNRMAAVILRGGSREDGIAQFARSREDTDVLAAFEISRREQAAAFAEPGALERVVAHPAADLPASMLLGFRISEYGLHGWDLARAIGADETIDPEVAAALWEFMLPLEGMMAGSGMFGEGRSGDVADDAPLQARILDLSGRRP
jgi:uncharacterized protein (TIGR03086 family)